MNPYFNALTDLYVKAQNFLSVKPRNIIITGALLTGLGFAGVMYESHTRPKTSAEISIQRTENTLGDIKQTYTKQLSEEEINKILNESEKSSSRRSAVAGLVLIGGMITVAYGSKKLRGKNK